jgi:chemotaxis signal transduction protein
MSPALPGVHLRLEHLSPAQLEQLKVRAAQLANADSHAPDAAAPDSLVTFFLGGVRCAVRLEAVAKTVLQLRLVVPLAGAAPSVAGVTFIDNRPRLVLDLLPATGHPAREPTALATAPALVLRADGAAVALAVEGPLELLDSEASLLPGAPDGRLDRLQLAGRLEGGAHLIDATWLQAWAQRLGAAPGGEPSGG